MGPGIVEGKEENGGVIVYFDKTLMKVWISSAELSNSPPALPPEPATENKAPDPAIASALEPVEKPFTAGAIVAEEPKPVAASPPPVRPVMPPLKAPWFEPGERVLYEDFCHGRVILGSESLADNDSKVVIELDDDSGEGLGRRVLVDPAELMLTRIWHPKHGLGTFLFELKDGEVSVFFDDKDGSSQVKATELSFCISFDPKSLTDLQGKMVRHPKLGHGIIVGEEENGKLIVVFDNKGGSTQVNPAELTTSASLPAKSVAEIKAPDPAIASALGQVARPFTPGAIAHEAPKPAPPSPAECKFGIKSMIASLPFSRPGTTAWGFGSMIAKWRSS
jgi:hypothetical protein